MLKSTKWFIDTCKEQNFSNEMIGEYAFELLEKCMFDIKEVKNIYLELNLKWNEDYDYMPKYMLKHRCKPYIIEYDFDYDEPKKFIKYMFDKKYFNYLANKAKTSINYTYKLLQYIKNITIIPLKYYVLSFIKLKNIRNEDKGNDFFIDQYASDNKLYTLRDLLSHTVSNKKNNTDSNEIYNWIISFMDKYLNTAFNVVDENKILETEKKFIYYMEEVLLELDVKTSNAIKINFLIYERDWLDASEYKLFDSKLKTVINKHSQYLKYTLLNKLKNFYIANIDICSKHICNGYVPLFNVLMKEEIEHD